MDDDIGAHTWLFVGWCKLAHSSLADAGRFVVVWTGWRHAQQHECSGLWLHRVLSTVSTDSIRLRRVERQKTHCRSNCLLLPYLKPIERRQTNCFANIFYWDVFQWRSTRPSDTKLETTLGNLFLCVKWRRSNGTFVQLPTIFGMCECQQMSFAQWAISAAPV